MSWTKAVAPARGNRDTAREPTIFVSKNLECAGILGSTSFRVVAPRDENRLRVRGRYTDLVCVDAGVERTDLLDAAAERGVVLDPMDADRARVVVRRQ